MSAIAWSVMPSARMAATELSGLAQASRPRPWRQGSARRFIRGLSAPRLRILVVADSTAIAIVSVSVAGAATVAAPWVAAAFEARRQTERLAHERRVRDVDELRALLDDAADLLDRLSHTTAELSGSVFTASVGATREAWTRFVNERRDVLRHRARVAIRLGTDSKVTKAFDLAVEMLSEVSREISSKLTHASLRGRAPHEQLAQETMQDIFKKVPPLRHKYELAVQGFIDAARDVVGTTLESRPSEKS
jgi:hypothetical protein